MSRCIAKLMYLEKPKWLIIWDGGSMSVVWTTPGCWSSVLYSHLVFEVSAFFFFANTWVTLVAIPPSKIIIQSYELSYTLLSELIFPPSRTVLKFAVYLHWLLLHIGAKKEFYSRTICRMSSILTRIYRAKSQRYYLFFETKSQATVSCLKCNGLVTVVIMHTKPLMKSCKQLLVPVSIVTNASAYLLFTLRVFQTWEI